MTLSTVQQTEIINIINNALDEAESIWSQFGSQMIVEDFNSAHEKFAQLSRIPNHLHVNTPCIDEFIALVIDMRGSSQHLNGGTNDGFKRVFFETSALLPALEKTIGYYNGNVTEYLGDGVLALFHVLQESRVDIVHKAYDAAETCLNWTKNTVNSILSTRYGYPKIDLGAGMAMSNAFVTLVGLPTQKHPKAIGTCVYHATKLSCGQNVIYFTPNIKNILILKFSETSASLTNPFIPARYQNVVIGNGATSIHGFLRKW